MMPASSLMGVSKTSRGKIDTEPLWGRLLSSASPKDYTLQRSLRMNLVQAILDGRVPAGTCLPSTRELADVLKIGRVTVTLTYERLVNDGFLVSRKRKGYFVLPQATASSSIASLHRNAPNSNNTSPIWSDRIIPQSGRERWLEKPRDWQNYKYPFIYGQVDPHLFPLAEWRECSRIAQAVPDIVGWASDAIDVDDPMLLKEIQNRILTKRGIAAQPQNMLITLGTQMALYLIAELLVSPGMRVAVEDPGYMDARNAFQRRSATLVPIPVDGEGIVLDERLAQCGYVYCTPSHQCPTGITMSNERRIALLDMASREDIVLIEDDYDAETQYSGQPLPALKAFDRSGRVIYIGSFSKMLSPGLRIGYIVAPAEIIERARTLRRLILRHPPLNNQRALAIFIAQGHFDMALTRKREALRARADILTRALRKHLPEWQFNEPSGGSSVWIHAPRTCHVPSIEQEARRHGVLIEDGRAFFHAENPAPQFVRIGYSSIAQNLIEPGIACLAQIVRKSIRSRNKGTIGGLIRR
jgi:GntR family transcriptional regulator/MocR family aminotransferase